MPDFLRRLWCAIVGHRPMSIRRLHRDPNSREARELAVSYRQAFGTADFCARCGQCVGGDDE